MENLTKVCSKCEVEKGNLEFHQQKVGKYGTRSVCKVCAIVISKKRRETVFADDILRERKNALQRNYTKKESAREYRKKYYEENKERINANRRLYFIKNPDALERRRFRDRNQSEEQRIKRRNRQNKYYNNLTKEQKGKWRVSNRARIINYQREFRLRYWNKKEQLDRDTLQDSYIIGVIKRSQNYQIKTEDISAESIETKRIIMSIRREIKNN